MNDIPEEILEVDDPTERALLIAAWSEPEIGADVVLHLTCALTGFGESEDEVCNAVTKMVEEMAARALWLDDPLQAFVEFIGHGENPSLVHYADQFASERFGKAREIASGLVASTRMRSVA